MIYALIHPASAAGLLVAFLLALTVRAVAQRLLARQLHVANQSNPLAPHWRRDIDPFGAVAAVLGGTGWGRPAPLPQTLVHRRPPGAGRRAAVLAGGPLAVLVLSQLVMAVFRVVYPNSMAPDLYYPSDVLRGIPGPAGQQFLFTLGVSLLCFALLQFVPLPPLDGFELFWLAFKQPGEGLQKARYWLADRNIGVVILLVMVALPFGTAVPLVHFVLDLVATPLVRIWT